MPTAIPLREEGFVESGAEDTEVQSGSIALISAAAQQLALARTMDEVKDIRDRAEAVRMLMRQRGFSLEAQNHAAELKVRAERKLGEMLRESPKAPGGQPYQSTGNSVLPVETPTLDDIGINKMDSSRWQKIATVPSEVFEQHLAEIKDAEQEVTTASVLRLARSLEPKNDPPPFDFFLEGKRIRAWLENRMESWPEQYRFRFYEMVRRIVEVMEGLSDDAGGQGGSGADAD